METVSTEVEHSEYLYEMPDILYASEGEYVPPHMRPVGPGEYDRRGRGEDADRTNNANAEEDARRERDSGHNSDSRSDDRRRGR